MSAIDIARVPIGMYTRTREGVFHAPLITKRPTNIFEAIGIEPHDVQGKVLDIGSGNEVLGLSLRKLGHTVCIHSINPAYLPTAPPEIQLAIAMAAEQLRLEMGLDDGAFDHNWQRFGGVFPDEMPDGLSIDYDWVFSLDCEPTITIENWAKVPEEVVGERIKKLVEGFARIVRPHTHLVLGLLHTEDPASQEFLDAMDDEDALDGHRLRLDVERQIAHYIPKK